MLELKAHNDHPPLICAKLCKAMLLLLRVSSCERTLTWTQLCNYKLFSAKAEGGANLTLQYFYLQVNFKLLFTNHDNITYISPDSHMKLNTTR